MKHLDVKREEILRDYNRGLSYRKLAKKYLCSVNTIVKHVRRWRKEDEDNKTETTD